MNLMECANILKDEAIRHAELSKAYEVALDSIVELVELKNSLAERKENAETISDELNERK